MGAESTRRSGRATKGQHRGLDEAEATPPPKKPSGRGRKKAQPEPEAEEDNAIIRCVCGATTEDEDEERKMVICEKCEAWQHNECMEISENDEDLPDKYYCEQCRPQDHKTLLKKMARGEKPWEERARQREQEEEEKKAKKGKGKKGRRGRPSAARAEPNETNGASDQQEDVAMSDKDAESNANEELGTDVPPLSATGSKRKLQDDSPAVTRSPSQSVSRPYTSTWSLTDLRLIGTCKQNEKSFQSH